MEGYIYYPYFKLRGQVDKFVCPCCGQGEPNLDQKLIDFLIALRILVKFPVIVTSFYRCEKHNKAKGGVKNSKHLIGRAMDLALSSKLLDLVVDLNKIYNFNLIIIPNFEKLYIHIQEE